MPDNQNPPPPAEPPPPPVAPLPSAPPPASPESQARTWNMLCHLSALAGILLPFGNVLGPLIVWQIKKTEIPSVEVHGKAALNFQITVLLAVLVTGAIVLVGSFFCFGLLLLPIPILIGLAGLILPIIAGVKANNGEDYKYPCTIDFIK